MYKFLILIVTSIFFSGNAFTIELNCQLEDNTSFQVELDSVSYEKYYDTFYHESGKNIQFKTTPNLPIEKVRCSAKDVEVTFICKYKNGRTSIRKASNIKLGYILEIEFDDRYNEHSSISPFLSADSAFRTSSKNMACELKEP